MSFTLIAGADAVSVWREIAELDRRAWKSSKYARYVPDGEHSWRVWAEYSFVAAAMSDDGAVAGALCAFDTQNPEVHFFHKLFIDNALRRMGAGTLILSAYCDYLDRFGKRSIMTTSPENKAMIELSNGFGFKTTSLVEGYYGPAEDRILRQRVPRIL